MDHRVRVGEARAECCARGDAADQGFVQRVVHHHLVGVDGAAARDLANAQGVEGGKAIGAKLDAGADLAQPRRLFEHLDGEATAHQGQCRGDAADAATGHEHGQIGSGMRHGSVGGVVR